MRKNRERLKTLLPFLANGTSILEIGCAEGSLAALVRRTVSVRYDGVEPSEDSRKASERLSRLWTSIDAVPKKRRYDIVAAFHVLEHIRDIGRMMSRMRQFLNDDGRLVVEVPHGSGNPRLPWDYNREHLHMFTPASLSCLLAKHDLCVQTMQTGIYESAVYSDSLRAVCAPMIGPDARTRALRERYRSLLGRRFIVYGVGGDYRSLIAPYIDPAGIIMLIDRSPALLGTLVDGRKVQSPESLIVSPREKILIGSHRFQRDIEGYLVRRGVPRRCIVTLRDVFGP